MNKNTNYSVITAYKPFIASWGMSVKPGGSYERLDFVMNDINSMLISTVSRMKDNVKRYFKNHPDEREKEVDVCTHHENIFPISIEAIG